MLPILASENIAFLENKAEHGHIEDAHIEAEICRLGVVKVRLPCNFAGRQDEGHSHHGKWNQYHRDITCAKARPCARIFVVVRERD